jgi:hypothetical protein
MLTTSAEAQGWKVKTHSNSAYRLVALDGRRFSLSLGDPHVTRVALREYAQELGQYGLRVSRTLVTPVGQAATLPGPRAKEARVPRNSQVASSGGPKKLRKSTPKSETQHHATATKASQKRAARPPAGHPRP